MNIERRLKDLEKKLAPPDPLPVIILKAGEPIPASAGRGTVIIRDDIPRDTLQYPVGRARMPLRAKFEP